MTVFELDKETETKITVLLLKNVEDIELLKREIVSGQIDCCGLKPSLIINSFHLIVAANKAVCSKREGALKTKSLNTELLFNLSTSKNITQALSKFGVDERDKSIIIVVFEENGEEKFERIKSHFRGDICEIDGLNELADIDLIKKTYKISNRELKVSRLIDSVVSRISTKDFGSY